MTDNPINPNDFMNDPSKNGSPKPKKEKQDSDSAKGLFALILAVVSYFFGGIVLGIAGLVIGAYATYEAKILNARGMGIAIVAVIISIVSIGYQISRTIG